MKTPYRPRHVNSNTPGIIGFALAALLAFGTLALAAQVSPATTAREIAAAAPSDAGLIILDAAIPVSSDGEKEGDLPPVLFDHDAHAKALMEAGNSCTSCHEPVAADEKGRDRLDYNFGKSAAKKEGRNGPDYSALKELYHDGCISCHEGMRSADMASGPVAPECRSCHAASAAAASSASGGAGRVDGGMDPSLHYAHVSFPAVVSMTADGEELCSVCHHSVDFLGPQPVDYNSCRSCHGSEAYPLRGPAYAEVAHATCISCHMETAASAGQTVPGQSAADMTGTAGTAETVGTAGTTGTGPLLCSGCHDQAVKASYPKFDSLPRLNVGQPDAVLMGAVDTAGSGSMPPVAFDHMRHEKAVPGCITCHDEKPQAEGVSSYDRVHNPLDPQSCVGCHETIKTTWAECAGCHTPQPATSELYCGFCHTPLPAAPVTAPAAAPVADGSTEDIAAMMISARRSAGAAPDLGGVPETVRIGILSNEYEPVELAHGKIIRALADGVAERSPGLLTLHAEGYALCQSCHHNSPVSLTPPSCASCHAAETAGSIPPDVPAGGKPSLKVAYHQQCMSCHQRMDIAYPADTDCTACHAKLAPAS